MRSHLGWVILGVCLWSCPDGLAGEQAPAVVYGTPGLNRIHVQVVKGGERTRVYWLANGTSLARLIRRARINLKKPDEDTTPVVDVLRTIDGKPMMIRFGQANLDSGQAAQRLLQDGDVLKCGELFL